MGKIHPLAGLLLLAGLLSPVGLYPPAGLLPADFAPADLPSVGVVDGVVVSEVVMSILSNRKGGSNHGSK